MKFRFWHGMRSITWRDRAARVRLLLDPKLRRELELAARELAHATDRVRWTV